MAGIKMIAVMIMNFFKLRLPESKWFDHYKAASKNQIRSKDTACERDFSKGVSAYDLILRPLLLASNPNIVIIAEKL
jgi:hypothetical protein